jgi:hypothetical protein
VSRLNLVRISANRHAAKGRTRQAVAELEKSASIQGLRT